MSATTEFRSARTSARGELARSEEASKTAFNGIIAQRSHVETALSRLALAGGEMEYAAARRHVGGIVTVVSALEMFDRGPDKLMADAHAALLNPQGLPAISSHCDEKHGLGRERCVERRQ